MVLLLLFTVFFGIFLVSSLTKRSTTILMVFMGFSFYMSLISLIIYLIKNGHQVMTLGNYFMLPEWLMRRLLILDVDRTTLTRFLLLGCLFFIGSSMLFSINISLGKMESKISLLLLLPLVVEYVLFEPFVYTRLYFYFYPAHMSLSEIENAKRMIILFARGVNIVYCTAAVLFLAYHYTKCWIYRFFRAPLLVLNIGYLSLITIFLILFGQIPDFFIRVSKITNYTSYKAYTFFATPQLYTTLPSISIAMLLITGIAFFRYNKIRTRTQMEEFQLVRDINNSTLVARTIGHYTKNEMLAIMSEIDCAMMLPDAEKRLVMERIRERCSSICEHLSSIAKTEEVSLHMKKTDVCELIKEFAASCRTDYPDIEFAEGKTERAFAMIDDEYFTQALRQLVFNAADSLRGKDSAVKEIRFGLRHVNNWCILSVEDNGNGIPENKIKRIFSPFYSTKPEKTNWGLGLSVFYNIIKLHDGHVFIESKVGERTLFSIFLPEIK